MPGRKVLVAGARGMVGRAAVEHFEARGWDVVGLSRRVPDFATRVPFVNVDLRDREATAAAVAGLHDLSHLVFAALHERTAYCAKTSPTQTDTEVEDLIVRRG